MARRACVALAAIALVVACGEIPARADAPRAAPKVHWDPAWSHANAWDYTIAGAAATTFAVELAVLQPMQPPLRWADPILFDRDVRSALRLTDNSSRDAVDVASWALLVTQIAYPVVVDVPYAWARHGFGVARDLLWQDAVTLFLAGAVDLTLRDLVGRARPYVYDCLAAGGGSSCVSTPEAVRSFPGGHLTVAAAGSVLTCTQHLYLGIYGGPWDAIACSTSLAATAAVSVMRIMTDSHWATDELAGLAIGALIGWGVPYAMHLRGHANSATAAPTSMILPAPIAFDRGGGLGVVGFF